jgi:protein-S-isoprenylcysteine O-methyltransferase Ste14
VLAVLLVLLLGRQRFPDYFSRPLLSPSATWAYIGLALTAGGLAFAIWARRALGTNWSAIPSIKKDHELIQHGPYRLVRHPIYTGVLLALLGTCLSEGRVWSAFLFGMATMFLILKLKVEEGLLARQFPEAYPDYRRRVKTLIPFLY